MRRAVTALALAGLTALPVIAQQAIVLPDGIAVNDPSLAQGLEALPSTDDIAAEVAAENAAARPPVDAATLADMQTTLRAVSADLQALRAELLTSGAQGFAAAGGDSAIDRMNAMEARIATLTEQTEQLSNRIKQVVADGTNRVGDIEFRLCELDPNCDLGALMTADLGGQGTGMTPAPAGDPVPMPPSDVSAQTLPPMTETPPTATPPTEEEAREFAEIRALVAAQDWAQANTKLDHLVTAHAGGPLTTEALYLQGIARQGDGRETEAAQSFLMAFSAAPDGPRAAASLLALSQAMAGLGTPADACPYLGELTRRFPASPEAADAVPLTEAAACADLAAADEGGAD
ncbi:tetratricopeptide repeat protein [Paracoccus xiamenensis]|uniref:tetratricopeptide repeat protein n=1 Tax=Paracoccus xiamenensis TaxID=2714901 RepID=UPI0014089B0D|nr:tol-pal system protein [Paracoccus xiamenensis]NHF73545.1 tol-pal system protein [Paracoccus xiamenensis]